MYVTILVVFAAFMLLIVWFDSKTTDILRIFGLESGKGPLSLSCDRNDDFLVVTMKNEGKHKMMLVGVQGKDSAGKTSYLAPYIDGHRSLSEKEAKKKFVNFPIAPGESKRVFLSVNELKESDSSTLSILDKSGNSWTAENFDQNMLV